MARHTKKPVDGRTYAPTREAETWKERAAFRALLEVGWACLTDEERAIINKWEGR